MSGAIDIIRRLIYILLIKLQSCSVVDYDITFLEMGFFHQIHYDEHSVHYLYLGFCLIGDLSTLIHEAFVDWLFKAYTIILYPDESRSYCCDTVK